MSSRQTLFSDVCGTMDELKWLLYEEYDRVASNPSGFLEPLLNPVLPAGSIGESCLDLGGLRE